MTETTVKIDSDTGLPELPEGFYWKVSENTLQIVEHTPNTFYSWNIGFTAKSKHTTPYLEKRVAQELARLSGEYPGQTIEHKVKIDKRKYHYYDRYKTWVFSFNYRIQYDEQAMYKSYAKRNTPDNILRRSTKLFLKWQDEVASDALIGNYPPKKFEG